MAPEAPQRKPTLKRRFKSARRWAVAQFVRAFLGTLSLLPFGLSRRLLPFLTRWLAHPFLRGAIHRHLEMALGDEVSVEQRRVISKHVSRSLGLIIAEILAISRGRLGQGYFDYQAAEAKLREIMADGRGVVIVTGHLVNWEALGWLVFERLGDRSGAVVARRNANPYLNDIIERFRLRLGMETAYQDDSPRRLVLLLREGGFVATVPDQDVSRIAGAFLPFFGRPAWTPIGPATLARMAGVPIVPVFASRSFEGIRIECGDPIEADASTPKRDDIERMTLAWSDALEARIRREPKDWMWFHERWRTTPERLERRRQRRIADQARAS